jgi:hypothetical protein
VRPRKGYIATLYASLCAHLPATSVENSSGSHVEFGKGFIVTLGVKGFIVIITLGKLKKGLHRKLLQNDALPTHAPRILLIAFCFSHFASRRTRSSACEFRGMGIVHQRNLGKRRLNRSLYLAWVPCHPGQFLLIIDKSKVKGLSGCHDCSPICNRSWIA